MASLIANADGLPHGLLMAGVNIHGRRLHSSCDSSDRWPRIDAHTRRVHDLIWQVTTALPPAQLAAHVDLVLRTLEHTDARVREWAVGAFSHLSAALEPTIATAVAPRASAALEVLLKDEDRRVRERATALIAKMAAAVSGGSGGGGGGGGGSSGASPA